MARGIITAKTAVQTSIRRACLIARQFTGMEITEEELGYSVPDSMSCLIYSWEHFRICRKKPDGVVNYASCMAVMEWSHTVKSKCVKVYGINADKLSNEIQIVGDTLNGLFPGCMNIKDATQCLYDGMSSTADGCEKQGWKWNKKLNEKFVALMSLYPTLRAMGERSMKIAELHEALSMKEERRNDPPEKPGE